MMNLKKSCLTLSSAAILAACGGGGGGGASPTQSPAPTQSPTPTQSPAPSSVCDESFVSCAGNVATLDGVINKDFTLDPAFDWRLGGLVKVGNGNVEITSESQATSLKAAGVTLTVPAGSDVRASDADAILLVTRGNRIVADGTAASPITFSSLDADFDGTSEWGGLVIQGFAPQYGAGNTGVCHEDVRSYCNIEGEGGPEVARYGGNSPADNSGTLRYVRIAEGGIGVAADNEVNGLTMQGVGHGTTLEYVQVHNNLDDAFEWFGGTVNGKYLVATGTGDDAIDFDEGYMGNMQYVLVVQDQTRTSNLGNDPRGIEANSSDDEYVPQTEATLANFTVVAGPSQTDSEPGMRLRGALTVSIYNSLVTGEGSDECVRIDDADTDGNGNIAFSNVRLVNVLGDDCPDFYDHEVADTEQGSVGLGTITLDAAMAAQDASPIRRGNAVNIPATDNGSGFAFEPTDYLGAVEPGTSVANAWWSGWTLPNTVPYSSPVAR